MTIAALFRTRRLFARAAIVAVVIAMSIPAQAVLLIKGTDGRNLSPPTGALADSGWQYEGYFGGVLGTAISPHFFITAKHAGAPSSLQFYAADGTYHTATAAFTQPDSDIALYEVAEPFADYAPLYTGSSETLLGDAVIYGAGTQRGDPVYVNGVQQGWTWGVSDYQRSWGTNAVSSTADYGGGLGDLLIFTIDYDNTPLTECAISSNDSGGGVFVDDGGVWKLAGINYGVELYSADGSSLFDASLWDTRGLYSQQDDGSFAYVDPSLPDPQPGLFAATRLSSHTDFIQSIIGTDLPAASASEPGTLALLTCAAIGSVGWVKRRRECSAS